MHSDIFLEPVTRADADLIYAWRNHPEVRAASRNLDPISLASHAAWLEKTLNNPSVGLYLGKMPDGPIGVVRFDHRSDICEISIYLRPDLIGRGIGKNFLGASTNWLVEHHPEIRIVRAFVKSDNERSEKTFTAVGYERHGEHLDYPAWRRR